MFSWAGLEDDILSAGPRAVKRDGRRGGWERGASAATAQRPATLRAAIEVLQARSHVGYTRPTTTSFKFVPVGPVRINAPSRSRHG
jgi:hypothetical protein